MRSHSFLFALFLISTSLFAQSAPRTQVSEWNPDREVFHVSVTNTSGHISPVAVYVWATQGLKIRSADKSAVCFEATWACLCGNTPETHMLGTSETLDMKFDIDLRTKSPSSKVGVTIVPLSNDGAFVGAAGGKPLNNGKPF